MSEIWHQPEEHPGGPSHSQAQAIITTLILIADELKKGRELRWKQGEEIFCELRILNNAREDRKILERLDDKLDRLLLRQANPDLSPAGEEALSRAQHSTQIASEEGAKAAAEIEKLSTQS
jgi:hypothetical protein